MVLDQGVRGKAHRRMVFPRILGRLRLAEWPVVHGRHPSPASRLVQGCRAVATAPDLPSKGDAGGQQGRPGRKVRPYGLQVASAGVGCDGMPACEVSESAAFVTSPTVLAHGSPRAAVQSPRQPISRRDQSSARCRARPRRCDWTHVARTLCWPAEAPYLGNESLISLVRQPRSSSPESASRILKFSTW